jgi:membrane fusion protein, multidrug efflux system
VDALTEQESENEARPAMLREGEPPQSTPLESPPRPPPDSPPSRPARRWKRALIIGVALLLVAFLVFRAVHRSAPETGSRGFAGQFAGAAGPVAVSVARATSGDITVRIPALGTVTPLATVTVKTQVSGQLQKIAFTEGQLVHAGDFLAQIDPRPYQAALDQAKGNLARDEAQLGSARLDLQRYQDLIKDDAVSQQQLDQQRATVNQFIGTVEADKASVSSAAVNLAYTHIVAPVTGRVGLRQVDAGNYVTPGDANGIVVITQLQPISVIFPVPEDDVPDILKRLHGGSTLQVEAYDRADRRQLAVGKLLTLDNQIDTTTGTVKLRALFDNHDGTLYPNQFVNVQLLVNTLHGQTVIPEAAVRRGAPNGVVSTFVYLVKPDSTVSVRPVTLGVLDGDRVAVTSGLSVGDTVVTEGGDRLRDGAEVLLPGAQPPAQAAKANQGQPNGKRRWRAGRARGMGGPPGGPPRF